MGVATGFLQNSEIPGAITQVSNFLIWSLDGYVRADNWTGNLIAAENFDGPDAGGWNDTRDWADYRVVDGIYYIDVKQPDTLAISSMSEEVTSFLMEANVTIVSAGDMSGGLLFNNSEAGYYALLIDASGAYSVRKNINGTQSVIQDWTTHFAIHTDAPPTACSSFVMRRQAIFGCTSIPGMLEHGSTPTCSLARLVLQPTVVQRCLLL